ncbi:MAG: hypothetical protein RL189_1999 [Pseudomonadota bacterium]|jgi:4-amino-4-deoxy-L-arabinose transferase-like glycosyltransferase
MSSDTPPPSAGQSSTTTCLVLFCVAFLLFLPWLGNVHLFDWDEINFAEAAREMLVKQDFLAVQIDFWPFWEKPPLFIWLQAVSMKIFGISEFAARFPNAVCGALVLPALYYVGRRLRSHLFGLCWALCYLGSFLPHFYFRSGIIDPYFNAFMFGSLACLAFSEQMDCKRPLALTILSGLLTGLAVLTKGPVGLLIVGSSWAMVWAWNIISDVASGNAADGKKILPALLKNIPWLRIALFMAALSLASLNWFAAVTFRDGGFFVSEFLRYQIRLLQTQDAGHGGPIYFHVLAILFGCFPASFVLFDFKNGGIGVHLTQRNFARWMLVTGLFVLVLFSLVQTKIVHYASMTYYPLTFFSALIVERFIRGQQKPSAFLTTSLFTFGLTLALIFAALTFVGSHPEQVVQYIRDDAAREALLEQSAQWFTAQYFVGLPLILSLFAAILLWKKQRRMMAVTSIVGGVSSVILLMAWLLAPSVEEVAQGPLIRFAKTAAQRGCDIDVIGHKSFIPLYYGQKTPVSYEDNDSARPKSRNEERMRLLYGDWKRPVLLMAKNRNLDSVLDNNQFRLIEKKQGFAFLYKQPDGIPVSHASCGFVND